MGADPVRADLLTDRVKTNRRDAFIGKAAVHRRIDGGLGSQ